MIVLDWTKPSTMVGLGFPASSLGRHTSRSPLHATRPSQLEVCLGFHTNTSAARCLLTIPTARKGLKMGLGASLTSSDQRATALAGVGGQLGGEYSGEGSSRGDAGTT
jgi:hypothetical protein